MSVEVPYDDSLVEKVVHASHHQEPEGYRNSIGIQCSWCNMLALLKRIAL